jgi:sugar transferase (PEP-CTERM/EpsH1 system associated)
MRKPTLVMHLLYRFEAGGMQTVIAECVNRLSGKDYRHVIVCLSDYTSFANKVDASHASLIALHCTPGSAISTHMQIWKLMRSMRPDIVHTYNIGTVEYGFTAALSGVKVRVHAEHGLGDHEYGGGNRKYNLLRRYLAPFLSAVVPVSTDLRDWLRQTVRVPAKKICLIANGVDTDSLSNHSNTTLPSGAPKELADSVVIGTVGRIDSNKNHPALIESFIQLLSQFPQLRSKLFLVIIGEGPLRAICQKTIQDAGISDRVWMPGVRNDVADILKILSVFVLPSKSEAMPISILEAMAIGLPVVATRVGGVPNIVQDNVTGTLVEPGNLASLTAAIERYVSDPNLRAAHGQAGRASVLSEHSAQAMTSRYDALYKSLMPN